MLGENILLSIFIIFAGAVGLSTIALYARQSLLVAYILLGILLGPWALKWVDNPAVISEIGEIGIIFLLFLLGLHLHPQDLLKTLTKSLWVFLLSSLIFVSIGFISAKFFGFSWVESLIIAASLMFSSTIIGLKLLPTTALHHQHIGEVMISILLLQDILAIIVLLILNTASQPTLDMSNILTAIIALPMLVAFAFLMERYVLIKLIARYDKIQEYIFIISIAWCLGMAELANFMQLSPEIGAFIGGVALAASPISLFIAESLKPLRDFFLVLFFFSIGASFNLDLVPQIFVPALVMAALMLLLKPIVYKILLKQVGETPHIAKEVGIRLGQTSEFSILLALVATSNVLISNTAYSLIQAITVITFILSSYWVVKNYPTPIAVDNSLRRN